MAPCLSAVPFVLHFRAFGIKNEMRFPRLLIAKRRRSEEGAAGLLWVGGSGVLDHLEWWVAFCQVFGCFLEVLAVPLGHQVNLVGRWAFPGVGQRELVAFGLSRWARPS